MKNLTERNILFGYVLLIVLSLVMPPYHVDGPHDLSQWSGYGFVFFPPDAKSVIDVKLLIAMWLGFTLIAVALWRCSIVTNERSDKTKPSDVLIDTIIQNAELELLEAAKRYEDGDISLVEVETVRNRLNRLIYKTLKSDNK